MRHHCLLLKSHPDHQVQFDVTLPRPTTNTDRPPKVYKIKLARVAKINTEILKRFIAGQQSQDNTVSTALMVCRPRFTDSHILIVLEALNVVIKMDPAQRYICPDSGVTSLTYSPSERFPTKGRSFFTPSETRNLGSGIPLSSTSYSL
jgi:eukaryotic translation initiation factor 2C